MGVYAHRFIEVLNIDTTIGNTKILCNRLGYTFQNEHLRNGFDPTKSVEV